MKRSRALLRSLFALLCAASCTSTNNEPPAGYRRLEAVDAGKIDTAKLGPGYLWFAGSELSAFTRDQIGTSHDVGPALRVEPSVATGTFHDLTFDPSGNLWTVPITGDQIVRLPNTGLAGDIRPLADLTIDSSALKSPQTLTFDAAGNLWVVNYNGAGPAVANIVRFDGARDLARGSATLTPSLVIGPGTDSKMTERFAQGSAIAFDGAGNLWFGGISSVMRFDAPDTLHGDVTAAPSAIISTGESYASLAFDGVGSLWITATKVGYFALRIAQPNLLMGVVTAAPAARVTLPSSGASFAGGMAFDTFGSLWVAMSNRIVGIARPSTMVGNVSPTPDVVLGLPPTSYPDLASKLAFWPNPVGLPVY